MNKLFLTQAIVISMLFATRTAQAEEGFYPAETAAAVSPAVQMAYRLYPTSHLKNQYSLSLMRPDSMAAEIRILAKDGTVKSRTRLAGTTAFCRLNLSDLAPGQYTVQIRSGNQFREEKVTVE